jgi:hypothetical protein
MNAHAVRQGIFLPLAGAAYELYRREPVLAAVAAISAMLMVPSFIGLLADTRTFNGINVWIKPLKFQSSVAIFLATFALFWPLLDSADRNRKAIRFAVWFVSIVSLAEILYVTYRASLAEASHFNHATLRDEIYYALMGLGIVSTSILSGWIGWRILRARDRVANPDLRFAIGVGLVAGLILGSLTGVYMSQQSGHWVGGVANDAGGSFFFGWSRTGGDLRVAHFVGLHAMQGIPLIGWLASRYAPNNVRPIVLTSTAIWTLVTIVTFVQAVMGRALFPV